MMAIKAWKMAQIERDMNGGWLVNINGIEKETEKAICFSMTWGWHSTIEREVKVWVPKSAIMTEEELKAEMEAEKQRFEDGCKRYEDMINFAKSHGVKVRKGMRKLTILQKIREAGLEYTA